MRKYLFKAKRKDNNEWVEGFYYESLISDCYIPSPKIKTDELVIGDVFDVYEVIPDTAREYIGRVDDNGNKIFEGVRWQCMISLTMISINISKYLVAIVICQCAVIHIGLIRQKIENLPKCCLL